MNKLHLPLLLTASLCAGLARAEEAVAAAGLDSITEQELYDHVETFADDILGGRGPASKGHDQVRDFLVKRFKELGLEPAGLAGTYVQELASKAGRKRSDASDAPAAVAGTNVLALLPGRDEKLRDEILIVSAHYDHLGTNAEGEIFNGADDNASGVAALLELAEAFAGLTEDDRPARSILFASWDLEEMGLLGSTYWVAHPTVPKERVAFMLSMDMLSRPFMGALEKTLFVLGTEDSAGVAAAVAAVEPDEGLRLLCVGSDLVGSRSDHYAFMLAKIPYLFFTTGTQQHYHTTHDDAETIDRALLFANTRYVYGVVAALAAAETRPAFNAAPARSMREIEDVLHVLETVKAKREQFEEVEGLFDRIDVIIAQVKGMIESGKVDETQRTQLKFAAGVLVFQLKEK